MHAVTTAETPRNGGTSPPRRRAVPGFFEGPSARQMCDVLAYCKTWGTMGVISGGPGVGKTTAAKHFAASYPNVWVFAAHPSASTPYQALRGLSAVLGMAKREGQAGIDLWQDVCRRVREHRGLIVIDEAQHLRFKALETLRSVHDETGTGLVLMGDAEVYRGLLSRAQLSSRLCPRCQIESPRDEDVARLAAAWGTEDSDVVEILSRVARTPGGLRLATQVMRDAAGSSGAAPTVERVRASVKFLRIEVAK